MMDLHTGIMESLLQPEAVEDLFNKKESLLEKFAQKHVVLVCNPKDDEKASTLLRSKGIEVDSIQHEDRFPLDGHAVIIVKESPDTQIKQEDLQLALESFQMRMLEKENERRMESLYEQTKLMDSEAPTIFEMQNRAYLREQHKFALRQSNKFRKK